ncbi:MAG: hypothetical protein LBT05_03840, partial [Planctomycetaceae bacterium]|nr:hypothetical protein [Planctomycetaceae bacterium]
CRLIAAFHQLAALVTALPNIPIAKKNRKINKVFFSGATNSTRNDFAPLAASFMVSIKTIKKAA